MSNCVVMERIKCMWFILFFVGYVAVIANSQLKYSPPVIKNVTKQDIVVNARNSLTLLCEGNEKITWTYPNNTIDSTYWSTVEIHTSEANGKYFSKLTLKNASYVDVDYYYCHAEKAAKDDKQRSTKIYIYVRDEEHLSVVPVEDIVFINAIENSNITIPCRPTSPGVNVQLFDINGEEINITFDPRVGYTLEVMSLLHSGHYTCIFEWGNKREDLITNLNVGSIPDYVQKPYIEAPNNGNTKFGDTYILNCTAMVEQNVYFTLNWTTPNPSAVESRRITMTSASAVNTNNMKHGSSSLTIKDVQFEDAGEYICIITDHTQKSNFAAKTITVFGERDSYINLTEESGMNTINASAGFDSVQWVILVNAFPTPEIQCFFKGEQIDWIKTKNTKHSLELNPASNKATLRINQVTLNDSGTYRIRAFNEGTEKELNLTLVVFASPTVHISSPNYHMLGQITSLNCTAAGNPIPTVEWSFQPCLNDSCPFTNLPKTMYSSKTVGLQTVSTLKMNATMTGKIQCLGWSNGPTDLDKDIYTETFYVTDVENGFNIWGLDKSKVVAAGSTMILNCGVSKYNYMDDVQWYIGPDRKLISSNKKFTIKRKNTGYTYRSTLTVNAISKSDSATYFCGAKSVDTGTEFFQAQRVDVKDPKRPTIYESNMNGTTIKKKPGYLNRTLYCKADGIPSPSIIWKKDDKDLVPNNRIKLSQDNELMLGNVDEEDAGVYACFAKNTEGFDRRTLKLEIIGSHSWSGTYIVIIVFLALFFLILVTVLIVKIKKEKKLRRELKIAGLMNFEKGGPESLNPDLAVDEQAELLPYDKKWELPRDKLKLGKQLGSGAFGVVMKAEAFGLVEGETITTVAVKMVKRNADYTYIKALASELKIMVHLGKHLNVVNLLGACTKNVTKRELLVIVEYCRFGNLHNYLLRHRDDFVNQIDTKTGQIDTSLGTEFLNRSMSVGSNQSGSRTMAFAGVDYRAAPNPSSTTDSTVACSPNGEDVMILSNNSSIQPEWRSNYRGDYKGNVRPTSTHDLLCWAFQVARGMEYLASRKVLHGDLAARNILLAEDNIVKICDFGLAKSMYKSDNYKKKGDGPLPVKWMAVESIRDRVFSTQSDVWSFGIVLWEFFSLARTPYPGMDADERLYNKLVDGYRMDQPEYSTKEIYQIMLECWHAKPVYRPSFTKLADDLGNMLQDTVRKHYIDLNDPYIMMNNEHLAGHSDYLAMLSPPDYGNLASPGLGPDYVNGKTFPEEQPAEASGYLKMDIFSPRSDDSAVFDFDVTKNKNVNGEQASGVELLPMLHANESDSDMSPTSPTKSFANPNYHTNPPVDSKENSAPKKDNIVPTIDNYINMPQQKSAMKTNSDSFSNPSYIHMNNKSMTEEENDKSNYVNNHSRDWERPIV